MHKVLVLNDTLKSQNFGCQLVSNSLRKTLGTLYPASKRSYESFNNSPKEYKGWDIVIVNGEGSFAHHTHNPDGLKKLIKPIKKLLENKIPVYLVNLSFQCSVNKLTDLVPILKKINKITLREPISINKLCMSVFILLLNILKLSVFCFPP